MLKIRIDETELFNENTTELITIKPQTITLEHSLVSVSKWEAKWRVPFLSTNDKTSEMILDYIRFMTLTQNVDPNLYFCLNSSHYKEINDYIGDPMTATWFNESRNKANREIVTSEIIYYWMISLNIPVEFQKWHLNRLLTLIRVCNEKNQPPKKISKKDWARKQSSLNAARNAAARRPKPRH